MGVRKARKLNICESNYKCKVLLKQANYFHDNKYFLPCVVKLPLCELTNIINMESIVVRTRSGRKATSITHNLTPRRITNQITASPINSKKTEKNEQIISINIRSKTKKGVKDLDKDKKNNTQNEQNKNSESNLNNKINEQKRLTRNVVKDKENIQNEQNKKEEINLNNKVNKPKRLARNVIVEDKENMQNEQNKKEEINLNNKVNKPKRLARNVIVKDKENIQNEQSKKEEFNLNNKEYMQNEQNKKEESNLNSKVNTQKRLTRNLVEGSENVRSTRSGTKIIVNNIKNVNKATTKNEENIKVTKLDKKVLENEESEIKPRRSRKPAINKQHIENKISPAKEVDLELNTLRRSTRNGIQQITVTRPKRLRANYKALLNETESDDSKLPIYKQEVKVLVDNKLDDIFEFDFRAEKRTNRKQIEDDSPMKWNKEIAEDLKRIKKLEMKKKTRVRKPRERKAKTTKKLNKDEKLIESVDLKEKANEPLKLNILENIIIPVKTVNNNNDDEGNVDVLVDDVLNNEDDDLNNEDEQTRPIEIIKHFSQDEQQQDDVTINESLTNLRPNANSSVLIQHGTPWRLNLPRHPLLLQLKRSSLPAYEQELVIDSSFVVSHCNSVLQPEKTTPESNETAKKTNLKQKSILAYIPNADIENEPDIACSLFDAHHLSPLKQQLSALKGTPSPRVSRRILQEKNVIESEDNDFDLSFLKDDESRIPYAKPSRFTLSPIRKAKKQVAKQIINEKDVEKEKDYDANVNEINIIQTNETVDDNTKEMNKTNDEQNSSTEKCYLFEDLDCEERLNEKPAVKYERKKTRRRKSVYYEKEEVVSPDRIKKKKVHPKIAKEEKELEEWATSFNAMCNEINEHKLTVEKVKI